MDLDPDGRPVDFPGGLTAGFYVGRHRLGSHPGRSTGFDPQVLSPFIDPVPLHLSPIINLVFTSIRALSDIV